MKKKYQSPIILILVLTLITSCYYKSETHEIKFADVNIFSPPLNTYSAVFKIKGSFNCETELKVRMDESKKVYHSIKLLGKEDTSVSMDWYNNDMHIVMEPSNCIDDLKQCIVKFIY